MELKDDFRFDLRLGESAELASALGFLQMYNRRVVDVCPDWFVDSELSPHVGVCKSDLPADRPVLLSSIAAISVGVSADGALLDLDYVEDSTAAVDMNVVMTGSGEYVEVQGTAEQKPFSRQLLDEQLSLAELGIARLTQIQRVALGAEWPLDSNA